jgi:hypothetical protein
MLQITRVCNINCRAMFTTKYWAMFFDLPMQVMSEVFQKNI